MSQQHPDCTATAKDRALSELEALQDYARIARLCREAGKEHEAKQLESEVAYWGCEK